MVASGVTRRRLPAGNEVICTLSDPAVPGARRSGSAPPVARRRWTLWRDRLEGAVVAIGNAPTALFRLLELVDAGRAAAGRGARHPGRVHRRGRVEGGARRSPALEYLVVHGRRGGSAMTVAAVNAIASEDE